MSETKIYCDICNVIEMQFLETIPSNKSYRIRRFKCPVCGHTKTIFADGLLDNHIEPIKANEAIDKMYKQEEDNRQ
jgi:transposase-like protein